jgi:hypothetical protein
MAALEKNKYVHYILFWICRYNIDLDNAVKHGIVEAISIKARRGMDQKLADECEIFVALGYNQFILPLAKYYFNIGRPDRTKFMSLLELGIKKKDIETLFYVAYLMGDDSGLLAINIAMSSVNKDSLYHYSYDKLSLMSGFDKYNHDIDLEITLVHTSQYFIKKNDMKNALHFIQLAASYGSMFSISLYIANFFDSNYLLKRSHSAENGNIERLKIIDKYLKEKEQIGYYLLKYTITHDLNDLLAGYDVFETSYCENCNFCDDCMCKIILEQIFEEYGNIAKNKEEYDKLISPFLKTAIDRNIYKCIFMAVSWYSSNNYVDEAYKYAIMAIDIIGIKSDIVKINLFSIVSKNYELLVKIYKHYDAPVSLKK